MGKCKPILQEPPVLHQHVMGLSLLYVYYYYSSSM